MTQRRFVTRRLGLIGLILSLVGLVGQGTTSAQTSLTETRQRADQGDVAAQYLLGLMYATGEGAPKDDAQVTAWYRKAAEQGHIAASFGLSLKATGDVAPRPEDLTEVLTWYSAAAELGQPGAQYGLGILYTNGLGVPEDHVVAHKWTNLAASRVAGANGEEYTQTRDALARVLTPEQLVEARRLAKEWQAAFEKRPTD